MEKKKDYHQPVLRIFLSYFGPHKKLFLMDMSCAFLVAAIAFFEGPYTGGCMGFYSGLLLSISSSTMEGAETLILALFGVLCGSVGVVLLRRILPSVLACGCALLAVRGAISATYYTLFYSVPFLSVAARYAQILLLSLLPGAAGYFLVRAVCRRFSEDDI